MPAGNSETTSGPEISRGTAGKLSDSVNSTGLAGIFPGSAISTGTIEMLSASVMSAGTSELPSAASEEVLLSVVLSCDSSSSSLFKAASALFSNSESSLSSV